MPTKSLALRPLGSSGIQVSEIGLGAWQLANPEWGLHDSGEALKIVDAALDAGCNFFDTAPGYGQGRSEELLGQALKPLRRQVVICTKFGHDADGRNDFSAKAIRPSLEGSLRRLQTDYIDVLLAHNPPRAMMDGRESDRYEELERLKNEGKIRAYGVSLDWRVELETIMNTTRSQAAEVLYNAFYQEPAPAFPAAREHGLGLIVKVPLDSGWLSGRYRSGARFDGVRSRWPEEVVRRRAALVEKLAALLPEGLSMAHAALQYILARPEVSTIIPGAKSVDQALDNLAAAAGRLSPATVQAIDNLWKEDIQSEPLPW